MSTQIEINSDVVKYLSLNGYRYDSTIDELIKETKILGDVAKMQIAPEQGQFLQIIVKLLLLHHDTYSQCYKHNSKNFIY